MKGPYAGLLVLHHSPTSRACFGSRTDTPARVIRSLEDPKADDVLVGGGTDCAWDGVALGYHEPLKRLHKEIAPPLLQIARPLLAMMLARGMLLVQQVVSLSAAMFLCAHLRVLRVHALHLCYVRLGTSVVRDDWPAKVIGCFSSADLCRRWLLIG